ncbi:MAG: D-tyrosyl-tRNA(Tyr) deacylase [Verrucomicrobia bacterium]|nr:D-tyrosyl-tRNA(Tyr) deacylase [Verrucomicrobiota bacterium]
MRAVVQRVAEASVVIEGNETSRIDRGLLVLLGVEESDEAADAAWLAGKIARMRLFADDSGKINLDTAGAGGGMLVVSQFTLFASTRKGNRPSFLRAALPQRAEPLYEEFCRMLADESGIDVQRGVFGADMRVALVNDGPVTVVIDSRLRE